jgi:hypothetical protein
MQNAYIAKQRERFKTELQNATLRQEIAAMLVSEDERNPLPVLESLLNRTLYLAAHGKSRTLHQMIHSGFYGPVNRGQLPRHIRELQRDPKLRARMNAAIELALNGSDVLRGFTDQGLPSDPGAAYEMAHDHVMIGGEVFGDWGGGPGGHPGAAKWRQAFEEQASAAVTLPTAGDYTTANLQVALNHLGANPKLVIDGQLGPITKKAVKDFQIAHDLTVDGKPGRQTWAAIDAAIEQPTTVA